MDQAKKNLKLSTSKSVIYTEKQLQEKHDAGKNINTSKTEQRADRAFRKFLSECGQTDLDYWSYEEPELDNFLSKFWFGARKNPDSDYESDSEDPERQNLMYSANTMKSFRYSLNRILKSKGHEYDIMHKDSLSFKRSQQAFLDSQKELKSLGKAEIHSAPEITEEDCVKLYNSKYLDPNKGPTSLQRKVQFDIRFYFCRRGAENMEKIKKNDFQLKFDHQKEEWYVVKVKDELTKNHRNAENIVSGVMPENKTDPLCPGESFKKYLSHLNPQNDYLWQKPLQKVNLHVDQVWYGKQHIGKNPLRTFMSDLNDKCKLSQIYTNHSIQVTGCTVLTRCKFSASEIMAVSSHKSVQSLAIYQKTQHKEKSMMGNALFQAMTKPEDEIEIPGKLKQLDRPPTRKAIPPPQMQNVSEKALVPILANKENVSSEIVPFEPNFNDEHDELSDLDLLSALCGIENSVSVASTTTNVTQTIPCAMFANCQIGTINVTINKK